MPKADHPGTGRADAGRVWLAGVLLVGGIVVMAVNLRAAITSLPPVFPELSRSLGLSPAALDLLAAVPVLCFGLFSGVAAPLGRRFGEERVLGAALVLLAAGLLLRGALPHALLFPGTVLAAAAIALMNVLLGSMIKRRRPDQAGLLVGLYLTAMSGGAIVASVTAVPLFDAAGGDGAGSRLVLGLWALPALVAVAAWLPQLRQQTAAGAADLAPGGRRGVRQMTRYRLAWQVMAFMGLQSLSYYAALSWFPTMFRDRGLSPEFAGDLLALMNLGNAITAMAVPVLAHRARDQRALVAVAMVATGVGLAGSAYAPTGSAVAWVLLLGLGQGATLGLGIFLTMARAPDAATAAALSGFAQGAGYLIAATGPPLIGVLHAVTGGWAVPVAALLLVAVAQLITGALAGRAQTVPSVSHQPHEPQPASRPDAAV
ncbi:MAG TPA: MFS transporter [Streptosporangiaceae bacterium]|nr:MFS transporter [Streptosporangiaceae bacterium]